MGADDVAPTLDEILAEVWAAFLEITDEPRREDGWFTRTDYAQHIERSRTVAHYQLQILTEKGIVERMNYKTTYYYRKVK